jgi:two-component sensor histidine kinase
MTKHIAPLPDPDGSLLLRELNHRVNNELTSTIGTISAKAEPITRAASLGPTPTTTARLGLSKM